MECLSLVSAGLYGENVFFGYVIVCNGGLIFVTFQVEIQVRKLYCVDRALPTLPINLEDAARSEAEVVEAEQVQCFDACVCFGLFGCAM